MASPSDPTPLRPMLLMFAARSGSTLLMQLLATSPKIVFERRSPFENRYLTFFLRWAWQLASADNVRPQWTIDDLVLNPAAEGNVIEPAPFAMPVGFAADGPSPLWHAAFRSAWSEWSRRARRHEPYAPGCDPSSIYYAEKSRRPYRHALQEMGIEHEVIYLLRDPRDILLSMRAFNRKRGTLNFSMQMDESDEAFAIRFIGDRQLRLRVLLEEVPREPGSMIVRYEDMVTDLASVAASLSRRYGVELDAAAVLDQQTEFSHHMSSKDPKLSVGRWKTELDDWTKEVFANELGRELAALGYEV